MAEQEELYMNEKSRKKDYFKKMLLELVDSLQGGRKTIIENHIKKCYYFQEYL